MHVNPNNGGNEPANPNSHNNHPLHDNNGNGGSGGGGGNGGDDDGGSGNGSGGNSDDRWGGDPHGPHPPSKDRTPPTQDPNKSSGPFPVILDLDRDGVEVSIAASAHFDADGDGFRERMLSWAAPNDGFLTIDLNADGTRGEGDGVIDQGRELAFALWGAPGDTDLQVLRWAFDDNGDGVLDARDSVWRELRVWQDLDLDGETDPGELRDLASWGIASIKTLQPSADAKK